MISTTNRLLINQFISTPEEKLRGFSLDDQTVETIFEFLLHPDSDLELLKAIVKKLYQVYQTQDRHLRLLTLSFVPSLVAIYHRVAHHYYHNVARGEFHSLAILLLCIYNYEIIDHRTGESKKIDIRLISLGKPSIYHESNANTSQTVQVCVPTGEMLAKINNPTNELVTVFGPYRDVTSLNTGNYHHVCTVLLKIYNQHIAELSQFSHAALCQYYLVLLRQGSSVDVKHRIQGFLKTTHHGEWSLPRNTIPIHLSSDFLTELTRAAYFCLHNDFEEALELVDEICKRATYKLYADVILLVNAIKNTEAIKSLDREGHLQKTRGVNQSQVSLSSHSTAPSMWSSLAQRKTAITNASFKTRKLPDDIPIVTEETNANTPVANSARSGGSGHNRSHSRVPNGANLKSLDSINEESGSTPGNHSKNSSNHVSNNSNSKSSSRKSVMNLLKELKDKPKRSKEANGKAKSVESNHHSHHQQHHRMQNDSREDSLPSTKSREMIALRTLRTSKFIDDDDDEEGGDGDDEEDQEEGDDGGTLTLTFATEEDDDENGEDEVDEKQQLRQLPQPGTDNESSTSENSAKALLANSTPAATIGGVEANSKLLTIQNSI